MNKVILTIMTLSAIATGCCNQTTENPLLSQWNTPFETPPFEQIRLEHYMPAFEEGIARSRAEIDSIVNNPEAPTFANTIEALERQGSLLNRTAAIFYALNESATSPEMDSIANLVQPKLTELSNDISLNPALFARVKAVYEGKDSLNLDKEQMALLEKTYKSFTRNGADLNDADKEKYRAITSELAALTLKFGQNVLAETNQFALNIPLADSAKVAYMPDFVKAGMAAEAQGRGEEGWTVTLQYPSYSPFLTYSKERDLKEQVWKAYNSRAYKGNEYDNSNNVKRIAELRLQMANLLGYPTYADYVLEERMAGDRKSVDTFLEELLRDTKEYAVKDYETIVAYAATQPDAPKEFMPWDFSYYNEKYKNEKYALNEEEVKPYLQLENVQKGTFLLAEKLYGITFKENPDIEVYHPDVKAFEVYDKDGSFLAVLYMDYFPRESKRGGAWMTNFREMYTTADGTEKRPFVTLNYNFTKPTADAPALLTFDEFSTFLHEFGHALHGMFAQGRYASTTGTNVYRDFVELPSQLMENWTTEKEFLDLFATHYQTGEKMPSELIDKIIAAKNYLAAYFHVRQLTYGINDMAWHSITEPYTGDVAEFENKAVAETQITPVVPGTCFSTAFNHIFSGGYATGYYSYKWAEVLEADAFSLFKEKGIFNTEVAQSFRDNVLSKGSSEHPMTLYVNFRGHKPEVKALLDKMGIPQK